MRIRIRMRRSFGQIALTVVGAIVPAVTTLPAQAPRDTTGLQRLLQAELTRFPGKATIWVKHLSRGVEAGVRADESMNSASVIKIPVLVLAFQLVDQGQLSLAERITITQADMRGGSGIFRHHDPGLQPTLRDVLLQMIITSDNTATDLAIARVGGVARVNSWLAAQGFGDELKLTMTTGELFAKYGALPQGANRNEKTTTDKTYWLGDMTARATGRMLEAIQRCSDDSAPAPAIASKTACADMIRMMRAQQSGARRLPHFLNLGVAHKTGDFAPMLANDVGIVFARSGPIIVSFFTNAIQGPYAEAEDRMGRITQMIVDYFDGR
ncbi:MAG: serine hydrolase [Gemmatimonadota bacterium]